MLEVINDMKKKREELQKKTNEKQAEKSQPMAPIVDFDQSFEPDFKPEEFTKEKTYIYEENEYLESLEEELHKITEKKSNPAIDK